MNVTELDARTIRDAVAILSGRHTDGRNAALTSPRGIHNDRSRIRWDQWRREFYSYGGHFPLAHYVPREGRQRELWIVNGDVWRGPNSRTSNHQEATRDAIARTLIPSIVLPFSALEGAGVVLDSIRPIHVRADATWTEERYADVLADVPRHERQVSYTVDRTASTLDDVPERYRWEWREPTEDEWAIRIARMRESNPNLDARYLSRHDRYAIALAEDGLFHWTETRWRDRARDDDGRYSWTVRIHRLGDSLFSAQRRRADGTLTARARYLSSFDTNETPPLYFLAQVPRGAGDTVETALDALAPAAVHAALARGRRVYRQGDIFYIETDQTRESLAHAGARFARLTLWTRDAKPRPDEVGGHPKPSAAERRRRIERTARYRRRLWRESFRAVPAGPLGRGPQTPKGERRRAADARARAERNVRAARENLRRLTFGAPVRRGYTPSCRYGMSQVRSERYELSQRIAYARRDLERALADLERARQHRGFERDNYRRHNPPALVLWRNASVTARERFYPETRAERTSERLTRARRAVSVYGTSHTATELAHSHGATYARGVARHVPALDAGATWTDQNRGADHRPFTLGDGTRWYLALRNRVPRDV